MREDVIVIGGGIIGVSAAYFLAREGVPVTLLEMGALCNGSSWGNAGLIVPCHSKPVPGPGVLWQGIRWMLDPESPFYIRPRLDPALIRWLWRFRDYCNPQAVHAAVPLFRDMQRASLDLYRQIIPEEGIECHFEQAGGLELFRDVGRFAQARQEVEEMQAFGLDMRLLDREAVRALEPAVHPEVVGGIHYREDAHLDPALFVEGLAAAARRYGAVIRTRAEVSALEGENGGVTVRLAGGESLAAGQVVLAAGAWSPGLARGLGVGLLMQPAKGYSITMQRPRNAPRIPLHLAEARMAVTPMGPYLRLAGTLELAGISTTINQRRVNAIARNATAYLAETEGEVVRVWSGMRPLAPDGLPYIGRARRAPGLILATGHAMLGVSMGPITGKLVAEIAMGKQPSLDVRAFGAERFS